MTDILQDSIRAVRSAGEHASDDRLVTGTRVRVRRSLERRARGRRRLLQSALIVGGLVISGLSWAVSTGRISLRSAPAASPATPAPVPVASPSPASKLSATRVAAPAPAEPAVPLIREPLYARSAFEPAPAEVPIAAEAAIRRRPAAPPVEALYRAAHELHFRGTDHPAALAAWDAYLAADPAGRFAIEARYNRALVLVRLGRYADARAALAPYARGEIANGYRATEARALVDRLDRLGTLNGSGVTGD